MTRLLIKFAFLVTSLGSQASAFAAPHNIPCRYEILLVCPSGYVDACTQGDSQQSNGLFSKVHICMNLNNLEQEYRQPFCEQRLHRNCDHHEEVDACSIEASEKHICVLRIL
jgi:hypothetical protein